MKKQLLLVTALLATSSASFSQSFLKLNGNEKLKRTKAAILKQQVTGSVAAKGAAATNERLVGHAIYAGSFSDSTRYVYSGSRYSHLTNLNVESYFDGFYPFDVVSPMGGLNYLAYDTAYTYSQAGSGVELTHKVIKQFDASNRMTQMEEAWFSSGSPSSQFRYVLDYLGTGEQVLKGVELKQASGGGFDTNMVFFANYSGGGQRTSDSSYFQDFDEHYRTIYTYNAAGLIATSVYATSEDGVVFEATGRSTFTYDGSGRLIKAFDEWNSGSGWEPDWVDSFGYTGAAPIYTFNKSYYNDGGGLVAYEQRHAVLRADFIAYDSMYVTTFDEGAPTPEGFTKANYNTHEHIQSLMEYDWTGTGYAATPSTEQYFYYELAPVSVPAVVERSAMLKLYPNPASNTIFLAAEGRVIASIYNLSGQLLLQQSGMAQNGALQLQVANLPAGTYLADVQTEAGHSQIKFVKQ